MNFWISLTLTGYLAGYPVIRPYRISGRAIWYPAGYPVHPYQIQYCPVVRLSGVTRAVNKV
jgi:hypothetical protein